MYPSATSTCEKSPFTGTGFFTSFSTCTVMLPGVRSVMVTAESGTASGSNRS